MSSPFIEQIKVRRTIYALGDQVSHTPEQLTTLIQDAIKHSPSSLTPRAPAPSSCLAPSTTSCGISSKPS